MIEHIENIKKWSSEGGVISVARVTKTWGSSPRPVGSVMLVNEEGKMSGSVSGGCVEGAVVKRALKSLPDQKSDRLQFGVSDEEAWSVGLSCGGSIQVFLESADFNKDPVWSGLLENVENNMSCTLISSLEDGTNQKALLKEDGKVIGDNLPDLIIHEAKTAYDQRINRSIDHEERQYFIHIFPRKSLLLIIGAAHITVDLVSLGNMFGFETVVIDPRSYFAENTTFNDPPSKVLESYPSEVLKDFPLDAYTFCAILSHDPKIDDNALEILLPSKVGYIGALGSRKTHEKRSKRLLEKGISQELIDRIHAPIGIPINAKSAREIAMSIVGEIIKVKNQYL